MTQAPYPQHNNNTLKLPELLSDIQRSSMITSLTLLQKPQCLHSNQTEMSQDLNDSWSVRTKIYLIAQYSISSHVQRTNQSIIILQSAWTTKLYVFMTQGVT